MALILASSSKYRQQQLEQLQLEFQCASPDIDETPLVEEDVYDLVIRLATQKAKSLSSGYPSHLIIGADQVLTGPISDDNSQINKTSKIFGKPGNFENALSQLQSLNGQKAQLVSGIALYNSATSELQTDLHIHHIQYRQLSDAQISSYLKKETPFDCAGSAKIEKLGIGLIEKINGNDPSAIIGLPLISLISMLKKEGIEIF